MRGRSGLSAAGLALVAGCAATSGGLFAERITHVDILPRYSRNQVAAVAAAGPMVEVLGAVPGGASPEEVAADLKMPAFLPQAPFRAIERGAAPGAQRFLLIFGQPGGPNATAACAGRGGGGAATDGLQVTAIYCVGSRPASSAKLSHAQDLRPGDGAFGPAMTRLFHAITPREEPERERDLDDCRSLLCL